MTDMSPETLSGNLNLLCKAKVLLERKEGEVREYLLNMEFKSKKIRMNLNIAIKSEAKAEVDETHKTIEKDRELVIQVRDFWFVIKLADEIMDCVGGYCENHEDEESNETCAVDARSHCSAAVQIQTASTRYQKVY